MYAIETGGEISVLEPRFETEFEVQAHLWSELRKLGFNVRGEVVVQFKGRTRRKEKCRFDLAIFAGGALTGIIEVKSWKVRHKTDGGWSATRQGQRYSAFGVPVRIVYGMDGAATLLECAKSGNLWEQ